MSSSLGQTGERGCQMALTWPLEQEGSKGEDVRTVQYLVTAQAMPRGWMAFSAR
jgi:hypothetical protein